MARWTARLLHDEAGQPTGGRHAAGVRRDVPARVPPADPPPRPPFRGDVEGLRAVAIGLVLLFHAGVPRLGGGFVGVDVFFVISGFVITGLLLREVDRTGRISLRDFYARRARRILPAAAVVLLVTLAGAALVLPDDRRDAVGTDALASSLQLANWHLLTFGWDELGPRAGESPLSHYWSLAVEEQFYLLWPVTIIAVLALGRRTRWSGRVALGGALAVGCAASFALCVVVTSRHELLGYLSSPTRAWQFGAGAAIALAGERLHRWAGSPRARRTGAVLGWAGAVAVLSSPLWCARFPYPGAAAVVPTLGTAAVITAGALAARRGTVSHLLARRPVRFAGRLSYSWYLWHVPVTAAVAGLTGREGWPVLLAAELAAAGPALLTMYGVERPLRYARTFSSTPARGLLLGACTTAVTAAVAVVVAV